MANHIGAYAADGSPDIGAYEATASTSQIVGLTGLAGTGTLGTISLSVSAAVALAGLAGTASQGTITVDVTVSTANDFWSSNFWARGLWASKFWAEVPTPAAVAVEAEGPTGGFAGRNMYDAEEELRRERLERIRAIREEIRRLNRWR